MTDFISLKIFIYSYFYIISMVNTDDFSVSDTGGAEKNDPRTLNMSRTYDVLVDYSKVQFEGRFALTRGYVLN